MEKMTTLPTKVKLIMSLAILVVTIALILLQSPEKKQGKVIILSSNEPLGKRSVVG
jgi:hypothetical protein